MSSKIAGNTRRSARTADDDVAGRCLAAPVRQGFETALRRTIASYDRNAHEYAARFYEADLTEKRDAFLRALPTDLANPSVLDAGCGPGRDCQLLAEAGLQVVGLDLSANLLRRARARTDASLVRADMRQMPFATKTFSGIWCCAALVHLNHAAARSALVEFARVLRPAGALFLSTRHGSGTEWRADERGSQRWYQLYSERDVVTLVRAAGFEVLTSAVEDGVVTGTWVNVLARRQG
jgi:SAM-dependent methyltransferase